MSVLHSKSTASDRYLTSVYWQAKFLHISGHSVKTVFKPFLECDVLLPYSCQALLTDLLFTVGTIQIFFTNFTTEVKVIMKNKIPYLYNIQ